MKLGASRGKDTSRLIVFARHVCGVSKRKAFVFATDASVPASEEMIACVRLCHASIAKASSFSFEDRDRSAET